ncbi:MAG TPA: DUF6789 family protein [bacterium]|nr:DUF6789 family protein [bacterium]
MKVWLNRGLVAGVLATLAMTVLMAIGEVTGLSPIPRPIPMALMAWLLRGAVPRVVLLILGIVAHFAYGGAAGAVFAAALRRFANLWTGLVFGVVLWLGMGLIFLPLLHWGRFGVYIHPAIGLATLLLHLVYGAVLGWLVVRSRRLEPAAGAVL